MPTKVVHTSYEAVRVLIQNDGIITRSLLTSAQTDQGHSILEDIVKPGYGPPLHIHEDQDETFFFMEGTYEAEVDGERIQLSPGDLVFIPKGTTHAWKNVGDTEGRLLYILAPGLNTAEMFEAMDDAIRSGVEIDEEKMMEMASLFPAQTIVGPPI